LEESNDEQKERSLASIKREIRVKKIYLNRIHAARLAVRNTALPVAQRGAEAAPLAAVARGNAYKANFVYVFRAIRGSTIHPALTS
jgi:hypothetical protein